MLPRGCCTHLKNWPWLRIGSLMMLFTLDDWEVPIDSGVWITSEPPIHCTVRGSATAGTGSKAMEYALRQPGQQ